MSFGFAIGDFIAVGQLAWTLYRECYHIARGAPQEFSLLVSELSTLSNSITILQEEAKDPKSTLTRSGNDRIRMVNEMVAGIEETLKRLRKVASKYDTLSSGSKTKQIWTKLKWSAEFSSIDRLRNKLIYHNTVINLLLTSVGNSSLQRIESSNAALASDVQAIKDYIASNQAVIGSKAPALSAVDDDLMSTTLRKWWLLRAQLVIRDILEPGLTVAPKAYAALIKAGWILADVVPCHPQFPFISASKSSELQSLSAEVKNEFSRITALAMVVPALDQLSGQDLRLWESIPVKAPLLRPYKASQNLDAWRFDGGEHVLFRRFAFRELDSVTTSPCILLLLVHESAKAARLIAQDQYGDIIKAISFPELSVWGEKDGVRLNRLWDPKSVIVGEEKFVLSHVQEAQVLCTMIEATTFYILGRQLDHFSLDDLRAYMLLTAVKNQQEEAVVQILQERPETDNIVKSNQRQTLAGLAVSMASQWTEGRLFQNDKGDSTYRDCWKHHTSSFTWAIICNHTALTDSLLSENPIINSDFQHPLHLSAKYGNESVVRWFLGSTRPNGGKITQSLYVAIENGQKNVVALLVEACTSLDFGTTRKALESDMSEPVVHAILDMVYATESESECHLREAADRGHEGAIVLLSYAETMQRLNTCSYLSRLTHNSGKFKQVVAALARAPNIVPAFDLTLMTVERRRTQVLLEVKNLSVWNNNVRFRIYLDSYHAYITDVSEGLWEAYKKTVTINSFGTFSFTVMHQEENLKFTVEPARFRHNDFFVGFRTGGHSKRIILDRFNNTCVEFPIN